MTSLLPRKVVDAPGTESKSEREKRQVEVAVAETSQVSDEEVPADMAPIEQPAEPHAVFLMLIDSSNTPTDYQLNNITTALTENLPAKIRRGDRLFVLSQTVDHADPIISVFDAVSPGQREEGSLIFENPEYMARQHEKFLAGLRNAVAQSMAPSPKDYSPICEAISAASNHPALQNASRRTIYVVTDAMQYVADFSSYQDDGPSKLPSRCELHFTDIEVNLFVINRSHRNQTRAVHMFENWLRESGARLSTPSWF